MKCPHCNGEHPDYYRFCPETGLDIALVVEGEYKRKGKVVLKRRDKMPTIAKLRIKIILLVMALAIAK